MDKTGALKLRRCGREDDAATRKVVQAAFAPEDVASFLDALRNDGCIMREFVAEDATGVIGHIVFSRVVLMANDGTAKDACMLTPLAVIPGRQRQGIGQRLMRFAFSELEAVGETLVFVLGHPDYYPLVGFRPAAPEGVISPWADNPAFMVRGTAVPGRLVLPQVIANAH